MLRMLQNDISEILNFAKVKSFKISVRSRYSCRSKKNAEKRVFNSVLAKIGADTAENEQQFANILPKFCRSVAGARPAGRRRAMPRRPGSGARRAPRRTTSGVPRTSTHYACSSVALGLRVLKYALWTVRSQLYRSRFCKQTLILHPLFI